MNSCFHSTKGFIFGSILYFILWLWNLMKINRTFSIKNLRGQHRELNFYYIISGAARFRFGGDILGGRTRRGSGGGAPGRQKILKISKKFLKKIAKKWIILGDFSKKLKKHALNFRALDEKPNCVGNVWENFQRFLWKNHKKCIIILIYFQTNFKTLRWIFGRFDKHNWFGNFWENSQKFLWK